jgi:hypothetical protein
MAEYQLFLRTFQDGSCETMNIEAENVVGALELAYLDGFKGAAELWSDGKLLCHFEHSDRYGYWTIVPPVKVATRVA